MKVRIFKEYSGGKFRVNVRTEDFSENELRWIDEQGDSEVDVGGDFTGPPAFSLPSALRPVKAGFTGEGFTQSFDSNDYVNAKDMANVFATDIEIRIFDVMQALKDADITDFEGESVKGMTYS